MEQERKKPEDSERLGAIVARLIEIYDELKVLEQEGKFDEMMKLQEERARLHQEGDEIRSGSST